MQVRKIDYIVAPFEGQVYYGRIEARRQMLAEKHSRNGVQSAVAARAAIGLRNSRSANPWAHGQALRHWVHEYAQLAPGHFSGSVEELWLEQVQIIHESIAQPFAYAGGTWKGSRVFCLTLPSGGRIHVDNREISNTMITSLVGPARRILCTSGMECVIVAVDEALLATRARERFRRDDLYGVTSDAFLALPRHAATQFRNRVMTVLRCAGEVPAQSQMDAHRRMLTSLALDAVFQVFELTLRRSMPKLSTRAAIVNKSIEFMEAHVDQSISIEDLCRALGLCSRTLRYCFRDIVGISPLQYLLALRLNGVRRDLLVHERCGTIEEVALRWGFWHMGRFAYHYRRTFAERPSDTKSLRCLRTRGNRVGWHLYKDFIFD